MSDIIIRFVKSGLNKSMINKAFEAIITLQEDRVWFTVDQCLLIKKREKNTIYIFSDFTGDAFKHLVELNNRIYGPSCILECIRKEQTLPKVIHPVFCLTLKRAVVSCTNLSAILRDEVFKKVEWMNGIVSKDLHEHVTHLVAGEVGSKKYIVAATLGKSIVTFEWIEALWNASQIRETAYNETEFNQYKCPIFKGLQITVSGLNIDERSKIKNLVEENGGKYSGELKLNDSTHLILNAPTGQKFLFAVRWKMATVSPKWLYDCISAGHYIEEAAYLIKASTQIPNKCATSTPTKDSNSDVNITGISNISTLSVSNINETDLKLSLMQTRITHSESDETHILDSKCRYTLETLDLKSYSTSNNSLSGIKIYLCGINKCHLEKAKTIVNQGGGIRFNQINESVTHIVIGNDKVANASKLIKFKKESPVVVNVVTIQWLLDSYIQGRTMNDIKYLVDLNSLISDADNDNDDAKKKKVPTATLR